MQIYFVQHGQALSYQEDVEEGLSSEGKNTIYITAKTLKKWGVKLDRILCSTKKRSKQTGEIIAKTLEVAKIEETDNIKAMAPLEKTLDFLFSLPFKENILIAGHLPSIQKVVSYLLSSTEEIKIEIKNGGITLIEIEELGQSQGKLKYHVLPELFVNIS